LKCYHPAAFTAALINSQPMGFYAPAQLIRDAREHDVKVLPIDVNHSCWDCTLESAKSNQPALALRLGMRLVRGLSQATADTIVQARTTKFRSLTDLTKRAKLDRSALDRLAEADAFSSLRLDRRTALWQALDQTSAPLPLFENMETSDSPLPQLPKLTLQEEVYADYRATRLTLRQHPVAFQREALEALGVVPASQLGNCEQRRVVKVAGLVLMRQRPSTAQGVTFVTLEDETGIANLTIYARTWKRFDLIARRSTALIAHGMVERQKEVIHVIVDRLEDMTARLGQINQHSRDFR